MGSDPDCAHRASACHGGPSQSGSDPFCLSPSGVRASRRPAGPHGSAVRRALRVELPFASLGPACASELAARARRALRSSNGRESEPAASSLRYAIGRAKTAPALLKIGPAGHRLARGHRGRVGKWGRIPIARITLRLATAVHRNRALTPFACPRPGCAPVGVRRGLMVPRFDAHRASNFPSLHLARPARPNSLRAPEGRFAQPTGASQNRLRARCATPSAGPRQRRRSSKSAPPDTDWRVGRAVVGKWGRIPVARITLRLATAVHRNRALTPFACPPETACRGALASRDTAAAVPEKRGQSPSCDGPL
jgi:hypothetical protein